MLVVHLLVEILVRRLLVIVLWVGIWVVVVGVDGMVLSLFFEGVRVICWVWWIIVYIALLSVGVLVAVSIFGGVWK
jgi:hypothetical protein